MFIFPTVLCTLYIHIYVSLTYFPILLFFYTRKLYGIPHLCNVLFAVRMHLDHVTHDWCTFTQNMGYGETLLNTVIRMRVRSNIRALSCAAVCIILAFSLFAKTTSSCNQTSNFAYNLCRL